jgi:hypothetical protein
MLNCVEGRPRQARVRHFHLVEDVSADAHCGNGREVDLQLDSEHHGTRRTDVSDRGGAAWSRGGGDTILSDEAKLGELGDQVADRRAVEACLGGELGAGKLSRDVETVEDRGQVVTAELFGRNPASPSGRV